MKILSKYKDYYDYLVSEFGVDERAVYVRKTAYVSKGRFFDEAPNGGEIILEGQLYQVAFCGKVYAIAFYGGKFHFGNDIDTKMLDESLNRSYRGGSSKAELIIGSHGVDTDINDKLGSPAIALRIDYQPTSDKLHCVSTIKSSVVKNFWSNSCDKVKKPSLKTSLWEVSVGAYITDVSMMHYGLDKIIPPTEAFVSITNHLLKLPEVTSIQSNEGKIQSHGFDLKKSFRKNKI